MGLRWKYVWAAIFLVVFVSCSTQKHYRLLSVFFDGVPDPEKSTQSELDSLAVHPGQDTLTHFGDADAPRHWYHEPYRRRECYLCHNMGDLQMMNESQSELCFGCHINYEDRFPYKHGPSSGGFCTPCHHPHESDQEYLLRGEVNGLCMNCHDSLWYRESLYHQVSDVKECRSCHNPHGSNNHSILITGSCYHCHDDFSESFEVLHGPVASGYCSTCHVAHRKEQPGHLLKEGDALCLHCHETARLLQGDTHADLEGMQCRDCHHPHGGSEKYLFN